MGDYKDKITVDTNSFLVVMGDNYELQDIKLLDPELQEFFSENPDKKAEALIVELAMNLHAAKATVSLEMEKIEELETEVHKYKTENEMLRDEIDKYDE